MMTKKVGQVVVRVWAVCCQCGGWAAQLPFRPWGPLDREWATVPREFPSPFVALPCKGQGSGTGSQDPVLGGKPGGIWLVAPARLQLHLGGCVWPLLSLGVWSLAFLGCLFHCLCFTFCVPMAPPLRVSSLSIQSLSVCLFGFLSQIWAAAALTPWAPVQPASRKQGV